MIEQSNCILYTFDELIELLSTTDRTVLGIDEWFSTIYYGFSYEPKYYEVPSYDFSDNPLTGQETIKLLESTNSNADMYSVVLE